MSLTIQILEGRRIKLDDEVYMPVNSEDAQPWKLCKHNPPKVFGEYIIKRIAYNTRGTIAKYQSGNWYVDGIEIKEELYKYTDIPR